MPLTMFMSPDYQFYVAFEMFSVIIPNNLTCCLYRIKNKLLNTEIVQLVCIIPIVQFK